MKPNRISALFLLCLLTFILSGCGPDVTREYFPNGSIKYEWEVKDGVRNGTSRSFYENGEKRSEGEYINDKPVGWHILYYPGGAIHNKSYYSIVHGSERIDHKLLYDKEGHLIADITYAEKNIRTELLQMQSIHVNDTVVVKLTILDAKYTMCSADLGDYDENLNASDSAQEFFVHPGNMNHEILMGIQLTKPGTDTLTWMVFDYDIKYDSMGIETQVGEQAYAHLIVNVEPR